MVTPFLVSHNPSKILWILQTNSCKITWCISLCSQLSQTVSLPARFKVLRLIMLIVAFFRHSIDKRLLKIHKISDQGRLWMKSFRFKIRESTQRIRTRIKCSWWLLPWRLENIFSFILIRLVNYEIRIRRFSRILDSTEPLVFSLWYLRKVRLFKERLLTMIGIIIFLMIFVDSFSLFGGRRNLAMIPWQHLLVH